ncbi:MAG: hypothetical protein IT158_05115 [Bryobacterales bacterium]|nr:hypothetical protein [Bryobacterales bacterium]
MSRYLVTYRKRFDSEGNPSQAPPLLLDFPEGVVDTAEFVERLEPASVHVSEDIAGEPASESASDDGFLAFGSETWIYEVAEGREEEFLHAVRNSELTLEVRDFDDDMIRKPFASS